MATLGIDVMHIKRRPYIIAVSKDIKFFQCMGTRDKKVEIFMDTIQKLKANYMLRGYKIKIVLFMPTEHSIHAVLS